MLLSKELGMAGLLQPDMSWDNNDRNCPVLPQPQQSHKPRPPGQELLGGQGEQQGDNSWNGKGKVPDALQRHRPNSKWLLQTNPCLGKRTKNSQNE